MVPRPRRHDRGPSPRRRLSFVLPRKLPSVSPFRTLKISEDATYADAKKAFLKVAMKHHPDTVGNDCAATREKSQQIFLRCRAAYESLVECEVTGKCLVISKVEKIEKMSDEEFDKWFEEETGLKNTFEVQLDPKTMREVASMTDEAAAHGTDGGRDGGMWQLASMVTAAVKSGSKAGAAEVLKLEAGAAKAGDDGEARGKLSRRRKRVRGRR